MPKLNNPFDPKGDGKIGLPKVAPGMNRLAPKMPPPDDKGSPLGQEHDEPEDDAKLMERIRKRMDRCISWEAENREKGSAALKFKAGDQWNSDAASERKNDGRPCLTINKIPTIINQVTNDQRQNRPTINVSPVGEKGDREVAKMYRGMIRAIERESSADIAYDTAFESAVSIGFGYWRIMTEWEKPDSFNQCIVIKRIRNPFTVYLDPDHQEPDGADCRYGFVCEIIPLDEYKEQWPKAQQIPFDQGGQGEKLKNWTTSDGVRIAEYFEIVSKPRKLVELSNGHVGWEDELHADVKAMIASGKLKVRRERESESKQVKWYKVNAVEVLEREDWLGQWIPIIPVIGNEIDIEGKVKLSGLIEGMMDAQRMYNYWVTKETEAIALVPNAPFIAEEGQVEGHEEEWKTANVRPVSLLTYKGTSVGGHPAPPPQRQQFAGVPAGIEQAKAGSAQDMMATSGIRFDATKEERNYDESGVALRELRRSSDVGAYHYFDNLMRSLKHAARQMVDLIPKIYDEERVITILREDDTEEQVRIDPNASKAYEEKPRGPTEKAQKVFNPTEGTYGVTATIGASYATRRIEAAESMMEFAKALPNTASLIADLIAKNMDWEGADEIAARLAKAIPPQLLTPDQKDVSPQIQAVIQNLEAQVKQLHDQLTQAMAALNDKDKDREIAREKIQADFETKLLSIIQKSEADQVKANAEIARMIVEKMLTPPEPSGQDKDKTDDGPKPAA